jgi:hypothetical protein
VAAAAQFGLYAVDFATQKRTLRPGANAFVNIVREHSGASAGARQQPPQPLGAVRSHSAAAVAPPLLIELVEKV